ncbi:MAG: ATP-binding cassette domain-containing protein [Verrucomicrobiae bacterium]|nr:ATP-binding cassette domain-containing protein [Verrucomicrobiae bacterium]
MNPEPVIQVRNLKRGFRHLDTHFILHVPLLDLCPASTLVFQGASGCGKSTLFDTLGLIARPDTADEFRVRGKNGILDILSASESHLTRLRSRLIGYVLQHGGLIPSLTVFENIVIPCRLQGDRPDMRRLNELAERLGIGDQMRKKPSQLSGGQQQRVAIARALINHPTVVLADEPTGQLDQFTAGDVRDLLVNMVRDEGATLLVVTHDPDLFSAHVDQSYGFVLRKNNREIHSTLVSLPMKGEES